MSHGKHKKKSLQGIWPVLRSLFRHLTPKPRKRHSIQHWGDAEGRVVFNQVSFDRRCGDGDDLSSWSWVLCQVPLWSHYGSVPGPTMSCAGPGVGEPKSWCPGVKQTRPGLLHMSECTNRSALAQPRQQQMVKMSVKICSDTWFKLFLFLQFTLKVIHGVCMYCAPKMVEKNSIV